MSKKKVILIIIIIILIIGGLMLKKRPEVVAVSEETVENVVVKKTVSASGTVTSESEVDLALTSTGQLEGLFVKKGDKVTENQFIGNVYNYNYSQDSQAAKDNRDVAQRDLEIYIENYASNLQATGGQDEYELNLKRLLELLSKAEAGYQSALSDLSQTYLYAPFDGTVIDVFADPGEVVSAGVTIVKVADLTNLIFEISVDQEDFGALAIGLPVEVVLDSHNGTIFEGVVKELPEYADVDTEEFEVEIALKRDDVHPILLGMKGDALIIIESTGSKVTAVTFDNVYYSGDAEPHVWINENGNLKKLSVEIGLDGDIYTEIKTDLSDKVLVSPEKTADAKEGLKIKINEK